MTGRSGQATVTCGPTPGGLWIGVVDNGRAMPGGVIPAGNMPAVDTDRDDLPEGGFGWAMVRVMTDDLTYRREDGENRLAFTVRAGDDTW